MNAFAESVSESDIRHSQSQHESDPNQYQYQHSVVEQSGTSEPRDRSEQHITYTHHQYFVKQYTTKCQQYRLQLNQYSQQTPHLKAQNSATNQQLQSTINQLQRMQTAHKMLPKLLCQNRTTEEAHYAQIYNHLTIGFV
eukprot:971560_1